MKRIIVAMVMTAMIAATGCRGGVAGGPSGTPNPPFQGEPPQDPYIFQGEPGVYGGTMVVELVGDLRTLNIIRATDNMATQLLWYHVFRCAIDYQNGGDPPDFDPGLCTGWESSPDAKQWTFHLRRGVRWSDGEPFTADDVEFTYNVIKDENVDNAVRDTFSEGRNAEGARIYPELVKLDDHTVQFNLHHSNGSFLDSMFNLWLIPKHKWEAAWRAGNFNDTMKINDDPKEIVSLGPYRIVDYVTGQRVVLERNPYFWKVDKKGQRLPYIDRLVFIICANTNTVAAKFKAGELDVMSRVRAEEYSFIKGMEGPNVKVEDIGVSLDTQWLVFNQNTGVNKSSNKPFVEPWKLRLFRDQKFRQAISYAIDREGLANTVYAGRALPNFSFTSPADKYWYTSDVMKYPHDPERARQMFAELGLKDANGDGVLEDPEGHSLEFSLLTNSDNSQRTKTQAFLTKNLQDVGLKFTPAGAPLPTVVDITQSTFDFDAVVMGWGTPVPTGPTNSKNIIISSGLNHVCFPNQTTPSTKWEAEIDELMHKIDVTADPAERKRLYAEVQRIWSEQLPEINLVCQVEAIAYKNKFGNLRPSPMPPRITWNSEEIYIKKGE
ncbi:MAG: ABC transporter substrate-binding protein [Blastocatellia bacterium]